MTKVMNIKENALKLAVAAESVANDIESNIIKPGRFCSFSAFGAPHCSLGHIVYRAGYSPPTNCQADINTALHIMLGTTTDPDCSIVVQENDREDRDPVTLAKAIRDYAIQLRKLT